MCISVLFDNTTITSIKESNIAKYGISASVFPNPSLGFNTILIGQDKANVVSIKLFDISGRKIQDVFDGLLPEGDSKLNVNIEDINSGVYFYRIEGEL